MSETMSEIFKACFIFSFSIGLWTCINIVLHAKPLNAIHKILLVYLGILLFPPLNAYAQILNKEPIGWLTAIAYNLTWFYGPILYLLILSVLLKPIHYKIVIFNFLLPLLVVIDRQTGWHITSNLAFFVYLLITQTALYCAYCLYLLVTNKKYIFSIIQGHKNSTYYWLIYLCFGLLTLDILDFAIIHLFFSGHVPNMIVMAVLASFISVYVSAVSLLSFYQPSFLQKNELEINNQDQAKTELDMSEQVTLRNIELSCEAVTEIKHKLDNLITEHQPHLDQDISLEKLAALLGISRTQMSEYFNVHQETTFYQFLNELRFQESLKLLTKDFKANSIADIAYQAGFNNRNTFYKVFKTNLGMTPSEYRKRKFNK
ncbi:AraC family transcriptional regulator [Marinicellulosiphila megalodicopiae]|uniref:AraC family transcriptional regulator n=1 Tax=Marinicellulosiphila megalodicopiae TaxID=2724896 RepID=UPI003BAE8F18